MKSNPTSLSSKNIHTPSVFLSFSDSDFSSLICLYYFIGWLIIKRWWLTRFLCFSSSLLSCWLLTVLSSSTGLGFPIRRLKLRVSMALNTASTTGSPIMPPRRSIKLLSTSKKLPLDGVWSKICLPPLRNAMNSSQGITWLILGHLRTGLTQWCGLMGFEVSKILETSICGPKSWSKVVMEGLLWEIGIP